MINCVNSTNFVDDFPNMTRKYSIFAILLLTLLTGCKAVVMNPSGDVAVQQSNLILVSTLLMLIIIVPVIVLTLYFGWRYRHTNTKATYSPEWDHSTGLELMIWGAPLLIIIFLGLVTWITTHTLDPYRPLQRLDAERVIPAEAKYLNVEVVALDWKWLFIYPDLGIATVNELAAPVDMPIRFKITASTVMNSFYIPALAGQIYAMPAMETKLHAVINHEGDYEGFSANYSGAGFSHMNFKFHGMTQGNFDAWVQANKSSNLELNPKAYLTLEQPSIKDPIQHFGKVTPNLFEQVVNRCVDDKKMCMDKMMAIDAHGGLSMGGISAVATKPAFNIFNEKSPTPMKRYVVSQLCTTKEPNVPVTTHD